MLRWPLLSPSPFWETAGVPSNVLRVFISSAASSLLCLWQGNSTVGQYTIQFCTLVSELFWNNEDLVATFWEGLASCIKDELASCDLLSTLDDIITMATNIDIRFRERDYVNRNTPLTTILIFPTRKAHAGKETFCGGASAQEQQQFLQTLAWLVGEATLGG